VDGTLLDLRPRPEDVVADAELRDLIIRVREVTRGALALVSGRAIADLDRIFSPIELPAAGLHGSELRFPDGNTRMTTASVMDHARPAVSRFVAEHEGLRLEDKGATLAVHFRARPELGREVLSFLSTFTPGDDLAVQEGKMVVELKPALYDKGTAIGAMMQHMPFTGRLPIFYGDDLTDEAAFTYVNRLGGLSVRIGEPHVPTEARLHLADPAAMRAHLRGLVQDLAPARSTIDP
jgi:trehalose 6-phosphate phosphatase